MKKPSLEEQKIRANFIAKLLKTKYLYGHIDYEAYKITLKKLSKILGSVVMARALLN